jgi:hypothetical protein
LHNDGAFPRCSGDRGRSSVSTKISSVAEPRTVITDFGYDPCSGQGSQAGKAGENLGVGVLSEGLLGDLYEVFDGTAAASSCRINAGVCSPKAVYNLAADMGGIGFIENNKALCTLSVLTSTHVLMAAREAGVDRYVYSSSACVTPPTSRPTLM